ncbi:amino acid kinase family-domain-containing protein [Endogone sp. FLAS-F59071]|nr:amino acid kinase family-domain-containing protein [Endogone sp. FLAS-F59071]|eukprot:RUS20680.1 amino acid kinase family-domain-containing protein [Endogone sp. FLAS-F59071]
MAILAQLYSLLQHHLPPFILAFCIRNAAALPLVLTREPMRWSTAPLPAYKHWYRDVAGEGWRGVWVGEGFGMCEVNEIEAEVRDGGVDLVMVYVHGGAFRLGHATMFLEQHVQWINALQKDYNGIKLKVLSVEYGSSLLSCSLRSHHVRLQGNMAPSYPGNLLKSVHTQYLYLGDSKTRRYATHPFPSAGDSAGGNLVLTTIHHLQEASSLPLPSSILCISPIVIHATTAASMTSNAYLDTISPWLIKMATRDYLPLDGTLAATNTYLSPLLASTEELVQWLPQRMCITVGGREIMRDDIALFAERVQAEVQGTECLRALSATRESSSNLVSTSTTSTPTLHSLKLTLIGPAQQGNPAGRYLVPRSFGGRSFGGFGASTLAFCLGEEVTGTCGEEETDKSFPKRVVIQCPAVDKKLSFVALRSFRTPHSPFHMSPISTVIVKIGGAAITNKAVPCTLAPEDALVAIACQIQIAYLRLQQTQRALILIHGAGSFGHPQAKGHGLTSTGFSTASIAPEYAEFKVRGAVETRRAVLQLHNAVLQLLSTRGVPVISLPPFNYVRTTAGVGATRAPAFARLARAVRDVLDAGFVPLLHGDMVMDETRGLAVLSGDVLVRRLAQALQPGMETEDVAEQGRSYTVERCVFLTDVEGVYDRDPKAAPPAGVSPSEPAKLLHRISVNRAALPDSESPVSSEGGGAGSGSVTGSVDVDDGSEKEEEMVTDVTGQMDGKMAVAHRVLLDMVEARGDEDVDQAATLKVLICKAGSEGAWEAMTGTLEAVGDESNKLRMTMVELE